MEERAVSIETADGRMAGFLALPSGGERSPGVVVAQEAFGVNEHIRDVCRRLAAEGYAALAPELYHRAGAGMVFDYGDFAAVRPLLNGLTNDGIEMDLKAAIAFLRQAPRQPATPVGAVGFCMGGFAAFLAACRADVAASVCFYGGGIVRQRPGAKMTPLLGETGRIDCPVLGLFGEEDASIPMEDVALLRERLAELGKSAEIVAYPGAGHGFFCDRRDSYRPEAARDAWRRTLAWLAAAFGSRKP